MEKITINNPKKVNRLGIHFGKKVIVTNITTSEECIILRLIDGIYKVYNGKTISTGLDLKVHVTGKPPDELIVTAFYMEIPEDIEQMIMPIGKWADLNIDENYAVEQTDIITITCNKEHNLQHQLHGVQTIIEHNTIKEFIEITFSVKLNIEKRENKLDNIDGFNVFIYLLNGTNWVHYLVHHDGMQGITEWQTLTFRIIPKSMYNKIKIEAGLRNTKAGSVSLKDVKISQIDNPPKYNFTNLLNKIDKPFGMYVIYWNKQTPISKFRSQGYDFIIAGGTFDKGNTYDQQIKKVQQNRLKLAYWFAHDFQDAQKDYGYIKNKKDVFAYYLIDEPLEQKAGLPGVLFDIQKRKEMVGDKLRILTSNEYVWGNAYSDYVDILGVEFYKYPKAIIDKMPLALLNTYGRCSVWAVINSWNTFPNMSDNTVADMIKVKCYLSMLCGAQGILIFNNNSQFTDFCGGVINEITELYPIFIYGNKTDIFKEVSTTDNVYYKCLFLDKSYVFIIEYEGKESSIEMTTITGKNISFKLKPYEIRTLTF